MSRVVAFSASIPVFSANAIQISGTRTPSRSRQAISTRTLLRVKPRKAPTLAGRPLPCNRPPYNRRERSRVIWVFKGIPLGVLPSAPHRPTRESSMIESGQIADLATQYADKSRRASLKLGIERFGDDLWVSFSGAEDVVLVDMAWMLNRNLWVFSLVIC